MLSWLYPVGVRRTRRDERARRAGLRGGNRHRVDRGFVQVSGLPPCAEFGRGSSGRSGPALDAMWLNAVLRMSQVVSDRNRRHGVVGRGRSLELIRDSDVQFGASASAQRLIQHLAKLGMVEAVAVIVGIQQSGVVSLLERDVKPCAVEPGQRLERRDRRVVAQEGSDDKHASTDVGDVRQPIPQQLIKIVRRRDELPDEVCTSASPRTAMPPKASRRSSSDRMSRGFPPDAWWRARSSGRDGRWPIKSRTNSSAEIRSRPPTSVIWVHGSRRARSMSLTAGDSPEMGRIASTTSSARGLRSALTDWRRCPSSSSVAPSAQWASSIASRTGPRVARSISPAEISSTRSRRRSDGVNGVALVCPRTYRSNGLGSSPHNGRSAVPIDRYGVDESSWHAP